MKTIIGVLILLSADSTLTAEQQKELGSHYCDVIAEIVRQEEPTDIDCKVQFQYEKQQAKVEL